VQGDEDEYYGYFHGEGAVAAKQLVVVLMCARGDVAGVSFTAVEKKCCATMFQKCGKITGKTNLFAR
jgi:hypothetical protein